MSPNKKADEEMDELVEDFLREETKMLSFMEAEKRRYLAKPESHRDYTPEWNYFYEKMCHRERAKVHPSMVKNEWEDHWERFVSKDYRLKNSTFNSQVFSLVFKKLVKNDFRHKVEEEGIRLLRKFGLRNDDIKDYHIRQKRKQKTSLSPKSAASGLETTDQPPTVLQTLRLLSAIEQFLGSADLGQKANIFLAQAKNLETKGGSQSLLERQDVIDFLNQCKEILMVKVQVLNEQQSKAARTCIGNVQFQFNSVRFLI